MIESDTLEAQCSWLNKEETPIKRLDAYTDGEIIDFVIESRYKHRFDPVVVELAERLKSKVAETEALHDKYSLIVQNLQAEAWVLTHNQNSPPKYP